MLGEWYDSRVAWAKQERRKARCGWVKCWRKSSLSSSMLLRKCRHFSQAEVCSFDDFLCLEWMRAVAAATLQPKRRSFAVELLSRSWEAPVMGQRGVVNLLVFVWGCESPVIASQ